MIFSEKNIQLFDWSIELPANYQDIIQYSASSQISDISDSVKNILEDIKNHRNQACVEYTKKFDNVTLSADNLLIPFEDIFIKESIDDKFDEIISEAIANITAFHEKQVPAGFYVKSADSSFLEEKWVPLDRVGCYIPGGSAPLVSTVMMTVIPAKIAGVKDIIIATPPDSSGGINPYILFAAKKLGVTAILKLGGVQAIGALAFGLNNLKPVNKIVGPGNSWVTEAKKQISGDTAIDMLAGPSEVTVICDTLANPDYVAADILSQLEHDPYSCASIITTDKNKVSEIISSLNKLAGDLDRVEIIKKSLNNLKIITVRDIDQALLLSDTIAPEHLEVITNIDEKLKNHPYKAGAVFLGENTPVAVGDFFGGTNHVLPTEGKAAFSSPLGVIDFMRRFQIASYSKTKILENAEKINYLAEIEGLKAHGNSAMIRTYKG